ncbi:MAG: sensor histidine kinase [Myxococcota bacterium]
MNRSIRLRIALAVFTVVVSLVALQIFYVLSRFENSFRQEADDRLKDYMDDLSVVVGTDYRDEWITQVSNPPRHDEEVFIEVRDADGAMVARSRNVPDDGLPGVHPVGRAGAPVQWEFPLPRNPTGGTLVRAMETSVGPWDLRVGMNLQEVQRRYRNLRKNLVTSLVLIALVGALAAYWVAARALLPVARIAAQARALGGLSDGTLPRTGSGDEIDRLAGVLNDLLRRIREEVLRVRRLTADAAHALRTPLTAIRGHLELQAATSADGAGDHIETAIDQVDELTRFVNRLLLLEKLESGLGESLPREKLDLLALARPLVDHLQVIAEEQEVSLECRGESAAIDADATQVRQAILNLLDNALRHTPRGGKVSVEIGARGGFAELAVADSGSGLPADELERVFERFYSKRAGSGAGTGLGLPIARAIARSFGGDVTATSPGGARFTLRLPLAGAEAAEGQG